MAQASEFTPFLDQTFHIGPADLVLSAAVDRTAPGADFASFTLIFAGPREPVLPEGSYAAHVAGGPDWELYIMPIHTHDRTRQEYQVVFN